LVTMKDLLEAGAHFGHKVSRWNPKMSKFIFGEKNGIYIIDLQKTVTMLEQAYTEIVEQVRNSKKILFVGTKRQAQDIIRDEAIRCDTFYISERWLGGMLTNFRTIKRTIDKFNEYETKKESGLLNTLHKKEALALERKMEKMERVLGGVKNLKSLPDLLYIVDIKREYIAAHEANILGIPIIAIVDTNTDPDMITIPIPANDDAIRSIKLITSVVTQAVIDGKQLAESEKAEKEAEKKEKEKKETKEIKKPLRKVKEDKKKRELKRRQKPEKITRRRVVRPEKKVEKKKEKPKKTTRK